MRFFENEIELEYGDIDDILQSKLDRIKSIDPQVIVGISRGGIIPAVRLSYLLNLPLEIISCSYKDDVLQFNPAVSDLLHEDKRILLVDDINNTGKTMKEILSMYSDSHSLITTFVLIEKINDIYQCDITGIRMEDTRWINFEYDRKAE